MIATAALSHRVKPAPGRPGPATIVAALLDDPAPEHAVFGHFLQAGGATAISRGDLRRAAGRFANFYRRHGVTPGEVVLIILPHSPDLFAAFLGAMLAGAVPSFMPPPTNKQDPARYWGSHQRLLDRIGSGTLLTSDDHAILVRHHLTVPAWRVLVARDAVASPEATAAMPVAPDQVAFLQHSSGTTGLKKGVALSHRAVLQQVAGYAWTLQLAPDDRIVSWLPLYHDMGLVACFLLPLITRTPVVWVDPFEWVVEPGLLFDAIRRFRGTLCWQPNFAFHHLVRTVRASAGLELSSMRAWINCSEPCRAGTFQLFAAKFAAAGVRPAQLQVCYAMAETVFAITQTPGGQPARSLAVDPVAFQLGSVKEAGATGPSQTLLSAGPVIPGLEVRICDEDGQPLPEGLVGEISVTGHCRFDGYYKLPEETRRKLRGGWYYTGDLGFLQAGELFVTGRKHDLIIVHGRNHYAHELEFLVNQVPGVHPGRAVVAGWLRPEVGSEEVIVIAEAVPPPGLDCPALVQHIKQHLLDQANLLVFDVHLVPAGWLVKTTSGKLSRVENLHKYLGERAAN